MIPYNDINQVLGLLDGRDPEYKAAADRIRGHLPCDIPAQIPRIPNSKVNATIESLLEEASQEGVDAKEAWALRHASRLLHTILQRAIKRDGEPEVIALTALVCPPGWDSDRDPFTSFCARVMWKKNGWYVSQLSDAIRLTAGPDPVWTEWRDNPETDPCVFPSYDEALKAAKLCVETIRVNGLTWAELAKAPSPL